MEALEIGKMYELEQKHWWFRAKRELVSAMLARLKPKTVLDIGSGTGSDLAAFSRLARTYGCEYSELAIAYSRKRGDFPLVKARAEKLPFSSGSFDAVTILDVLEHLDDDRGAMAEILRILKPGGHVVINVPAHMFLWQKADDYLHHKRRYNFEELRSKLLDAGFEIRKLTYWNFLLFPLSMAFKKMNQEDNTKKHGRLSNFLLRAALSLDNILISKGLFLPFGVSLFCIARKA
jgi:ubiquinone/menaquinone biosynthesis C-methylase UbiE